MSLPHERHRLGAAPRRGLGVTRSALYREALDRGLAGERRRRAVIQLASHAEESVALLAAECEAGSDTLALTDVGREREAVSLALGALAKHLPRYQRSLANSRLLVEPEDS